MIVSVCLGAGSLTDSCPSSSPSLCTCFVCQLSWHVFLFVAPRRSLPVRDQKAPPQAKHIQASDYMNISCGWTKDGVRFEEDVGFCGTETGWQEAKERQGKPNRQYIICQQSCGRKEADKTERIDWRPEGPVGGQLSLIQRCKTWGTPVHLSMGLSDPFNKRINTQ